MVHNLLPKAKKGKLRKEYALRLVNVLVILLVAATVLGTIALMPAYIRVSSDLQVVKETQAMMTSEEEDSSPIAELEEIGTTVALLRAKLSHEPISSVMPLVLNTRPEGVAVQGFAYERGQAEITLEGTAVTRDALVLYKRHLEDIERITNIKSPISDLAKNTNLPFRLTFTVVEPQ